MPVPHFDTLVLSDRELTRLQDNVDRVLNPLVGLPLIQGQLLTGVALQSAVTTNVQHKLGRRLQGWCVADINANATVWRDAAATNPSPNAILQLKCSADCTVSLWVF